MLNQYYIPDIASSGQLLSELCEGLVSRGHSVTVVTAQPSYLEGVPDQPSREVINGVKVIRTSMQRTKGRGNLGKRISGYVRFLFQSWFAVRNELKLETYDVVMTLSNPPFVGVLGALISKKYNLPYYCVIYDIHPDIVRESQWISLPEFLFDIWNRLMIWVIGVSAKVIVLSERMKLTVSESKLVPLEKIEVIPVWATPELVKFESSRPKDDVRHQLGIPEGSLLIISAGNVGIMQPVEVILNVAERISTLPLHILFLGGGSNWESVTNEAKNRKIDNVSFLPYQPIEFFKEIICSSDACIVSLGKGFEKYSVPSRAFTFFSAAKPVISVMERDSDIADIVLNNDCGWHANGESELKSIFEEMVGSDKDLVTMGRNGRKLYLSMHNKDLVVDKFDSMFACVEKRS